MCWGHRCPRMAVTQAGSLGGWEGRRVGAQPRVGRAGVSPTPAKTAPGMAEPEAPSARAAPALPPAPSISDAAHYNPIRLFMQTIRFYVSVKSLNNLNQRERPEILAGGGCGLLGGRQDTLPGSCPPPAAPAPPGGLSTEGRVGDAVPQASVAARGSEPSRWRCWRRGSQRPSVSHPASPSPAAGGGLGVRVPLPTATRTPAPSSPSPRGH